MPFPGSFFLYISYEGLPGKRVQCAIVPYFYSGTSGISAAISRIFFFSGHCTQGSGSGKDSPAPEMTCTPPNSRLRRRVLTGGVRVAQNITYSRKTDTIVLRSPQYAMRLAGFGMNRAPKKPLLAPFGRQSIAGMSWGRRKVKEGLFWGSSSLRTPT